ncbi:uncharacterized protein FTOL_13767 [Fusarium torulosum]|uniref:Uncharacterized protein n=1 Tax=Fusarium torulosum TaxID=33205 RepID=A0AAE8MNL9_9HYPO|nr:uncharacterized protein FTOL_13767 [Fusarium torulosum]
MAWMGILVVLTEQPTAVWRNSSISLMFGDGNTASDVTIVIDCGSEILRGRESKQQGASYCVRAEQRIMTATKGLRQFVQQDFGRKGLGLG